MFISADVYKKTSTVVTTVDHGLQEGDQIDITVLSGINTTLRVTYDDLNRRMLINPETFIDSDVNINENTIQILNHGFRTGEKIILNSSSPPTGLNNGQLYYMIVVDDNRIQLSDYYYETITSNVNVEVKNLVAQFPGTISRVNPEIKAVRNSTIIFDLSDQTLVANSLPAFSFSLYSNTGLLMSSLLQKIMLEHLMLKLQENLETLVQN